MREPRAEIPALDQLPLVLETPRLRLRPFVEADVADLWPLVSDPALTRMMSWSAHRDPAETLAFIRHMAAGRAAGTDLAWAVEHEGRASGVIGLHGITWTVAALRVDRAELGYWIAPQLRGRGLITEAARAVLLFAFGTLGLHKITVRCFEENAASRRVIEKAGFRFLARAQDDAWRDGRWWSDLIYELTALEWVASAR